MLRKLRCASFTSKVQLRKLRCALLTFKLQKLRCALAKSKLHLRILCCAFFIHRNCFNLLHCASAVPEKVPSTADMCNKFTELILVTENKGKMETVNEEDCHGHGDW